MSPVGKLLVVSLLLVGLLKPSFGLETDYCVNQYQCNWGQRVCAYNSRTGARQYFRSEGCLKREQCRHSYWKLCPNWRPNKPCDKAHCN